MIRTAKRACLLGLIGLVVACGPKELRDQPHTVEQYVQDAELRRMTVDSCNENYDAYKDNEACVNVAEASKQVMSSESFSYP